MAGDWIKIEHTTPDKPEVVGIAARLKIDQDAVAGKLLRIWIWADQNSVDGNAMGVTESFLDRLTGRRGFAAAMRHVGWLSGDDGTLTFPGFLRHNGASAKARADTNRRVAKHRKRNTNVTPEPLQKPLPEKRREEKSIEEAIASSPAAASQNPSQAETLCLTHPSRACTAPALQAALHALTQHPFEIILEGTKAYANAVAEWTPAERIQFVKNPEAFFREAIWNQPAANWKSRTAARRENASQSQRVMDLEAARASLGRRGAQTTTAP